MVTVPVLAAFGLVPADIPLTAAETWLTDDQWAVLVGLLGIIALTSIVQTVNGWRNG